MANAKATVLLAVLATVLFCAHAAWSDPVVSGTGTGTVNLTVEKFVSIWIPAGPGDGVQAGAYGMRVTPSTYIGTNKPVQTLLRIYALTNCGTWVRVPSKLKLQDHGAYEAEALVTLESDGSMVDSDGVYYYQRFASAIEPGPGQRIMNATVSVTKHPWSAHDLAGYYWQTLFVDIQASDASTIPGGWPTHTEPTDPPHSF